tara:strand:+ start:1171 stop:1386 length:216 start_codon:yes stop_codon:yes gene_type:complete
MRSLLYDVDCSLEGLHDELFGLLGPPVGIKLSGHPGDQPQETPEVLQDILIVPHLFECIPLVYQKDLIKES